MKISAASVLQTYATVRRALAHLMVCPKKPSLPRAGASTGAGDVLCPAWRHTSRTGTLKAASSLCRVGAAREDEQLRMKRRGGGLSLG